jgi:hypothetical protein
VRGGHTGGEGGGLLNLGSLTLQDTMVTDNQASFGGGIFNINLDAFLAI